MNRLLITFLALLTGFVAQVSPAAASVRAAGQTEVGALAAADVQLRRGAAVVIGRLHVSEGRPVAAEAACAPGTATGALVRAVLIGIDRARE